MFGRLLINFKVTLTGQSHSMLIFVLGKVTLPNRINSVPWMNAVTPTPYHECTQLAQKILWLNWMKLSWRSRKTACIHGTELVWQSSFMVRSWCHLVKKFRSWCDLVYCWCDPAKLLCVVSVYTLHCTEGFIWQILCLCFRAKIHKFTF